MSIQVLVIFYSFTAGMLGAIGDGFLNKGTKVMEDRFWWYLSGFLVWNVSLWFFLQVLKKGNLVDSVVLFAIANSIVAVILSQFVFKEHVSFDKWVAIIIGFIVVIFLSKH